MQEQTRVKASEARAMSLLHTHGIEIVQDGSVFKYKVRGELKSPEYPSLVAALIGAEHHVRVYAVEEEKEEQTV